MKTYLRIIGSIVAMSFAQANAQNSFQLNLGGKDNVETIKNSMIFSGNGVSATAKAWSISRTATNAKLQASEIAQWSPGIGVKNSTETITDVPYVPYYVDNEDHYDFVLFVFDQNVDITSISLTPSGKNFDTDVSYWFGNVSQDVSLTGKDLNQLSALGFGSRFDNTTTASSSSRTVSISSPVDGVNALLVGARVETGTSFDRFKLSAVSGTTSPAAVPEPSALGLFALGMALAAGRRKR